MSDALIETPADDPNVDSGAEVEVDAGEAAQATEPTGPTFDDFDTYQDHLVKVKVTGEEQYVPLADLRDGYSRTQDYTAKTQALAAERSELKQAAAIQQALAQDPQQTLTVLAEVYGVDFANAVAAEQGLSEDGDDEDMDPMAQRVAAMEQTFAQQQQAQQYAALEVELDRVVGAYGVDGDELVQMALLKGTDDLELVAQSMAYAAQAETAQAAAAAQREGKVDAKRDAAVIHGGGTNPAASASPHAVSTYEQAAQAALAAHGVI